MSVAFLSLGSNLGDRQYFLNRAVELMEKAGIVLLKSSTVIETAPVGGPPQGNYLNCVLKVQTDLLLEDFFLNLSLIEKRLGRLRKIKNGPRVIDIDILLFDDIKLVTKNLMIPHPRMFSRDFVMRPLAEIEPELCASFIQ